MQVVLRSTSKLRRASFMAYAIYALFLYLFFEFVHLPSTTIIMFFAYTFFLQLFYHMRARRKALIFNAYGIAEANGAITQWQISWAEIQTISFHRRGMRRYAIELRINIRDRPTKIIPFGRWRPSPWESSTGNTIKTSNSEAMFSQVFALFGHQVQDNSGA